MLQMVVKGIGCTSTANYAFRYTGSITDKFLPDTENGRT